MNYIILKYSLSHCLNIFAACPLISHIVIHSTVYIHSNKSSLSYHVTANQTFRKKLSSLIVKGCHYQGTLKVLGRTLQQTEFQVEAFQEAKSP